MIKCRKLLTYLGENLFFDKNYEIGPFTLKRKQKKGSAHGIFLRFLPKWAGQSPKVSVISKVGHGTGSRLLSSQNLDIW